MLLAMVIAWHWPPHWLSSLVPFRGCTATNLPILCQTQLSTLMLLLHIVYFINVISFKAKNRGRPRPSWQPTIL